MKTVYTVCFSVEAGQDPVSEDGLGYSSNVLARYVIASIHDRSGFCTQDKVLRCPGASSPAYPALNGIGACTIVWPCTPHQLHCIPYHVLCSGYFSDDLLKPENISAGHNYVQLRFKSGRGGQNYLYLFFSFWIIYVYIKHESVKLGFWKRVGALQFYGILGRKNKERLLQIVGHTTNGYFIFLHRLKKGCLSFWRGSVYLVGQHHIGEDRPFQES